MAKSSNGVAHTEQVVQIPIDQITPSPFQPRKYFEERSLRELAQTIKKKNGVVQPVTVRPLPGKKYQLVVGERRWRAAKVAGLRSISAIIRKLSDNEAAEESSIENLQREDLTPSEEGQATKNMIDLGLRLEEVAERIGKSTSYLQARLDLLELPKEVQTLVDHNKITMAHAEVLKDLPNVSDLKEAAKMATHQKLTAAQLKARTQHKLAQRAASPPRVSTYGSKDLSREIISLHANLERLELDPEMTEVNRRSLAKQIGSLIKSLEKVQQRVVSAQASRKR